jgi:chemotaxis family two-component system sensor kinase Cph1
MPPDGDWPLNFAAIAPRGPLSSPFHKLFSMVMRPETRPKFPCPYDREPIDRPGSIQPHGLLFVLDGPDAIVQQVSANTTAIVQIPPHDLLGKSLIPWLGDPFRALLGQAIERDFEAINPLELHWHPTDPSAAPIPFTGIAHRNPQGLTLLELEPATRRDLDFSDFYRLSKPALSRIQRTQNLEDLCQELAHQVHHITGFDRVMVYRFDTDDSGLVIAETRRPDLESFLGLHYPAADVPDTARRLYGLNPIRTIINAVYEPVPIVRRAESPGASDHLAHSDSSNLLNSSNVLNSSKIEPSGDAIDLSFSVLRSVSPCHLQYLQNMGVTGSMSISLLKEGRLWGLIACHHYAPRFVPYALRTVCEFLGQVASIELGSKEERQQLAYRHRLQSLQKQFVDRIAEASFFSNALTTDPKALLELVGASGVILVDGSAMTSAGLVPPESFIDPLLEWLCDRFENNRFATDSLPRLYEPAMAHRDCASGLLALAISRIQRYFVLWFRPEKLMAVSWAGNPQEATQRQIEADGSVTMLPRNSFAAWQEIVRYQSAPWQPCELDGAIELRSAIVSIALKRADELSELNLELQRSNSELDSFTYIASHDLREPLRGIHNYSTFLLEDYGTVLDPDGVDKLQTLVRLTQRMDGLIETLLRFSRLGRQELNCVPVDLNQAIAIATEVCQLHRQGEAIEIACEGDLPAAWGDRILLEEVFTNLIGNALKYNESTPKTVTIGQVQSPASGPILPINPDHGAPITLFIRDNGIGIRPQHLDSVFRIFKRLHGPTRYGGGTGAGLTIVKKIIERHGGTIWIESTYGEGSTFFLTLPAVPDANPTP